MKPIIPPGSLVLVLVWSSCTQPQLPEAEALLKQSVAYHDPAGIFMQRTHRIELAETRPGRPTRETTITFDGMGTGLELVQRRDGYLIEAEVGPDECQATLDDSSSIPDSLLTRYRLTCDGLRWVRDFYAFLFALPMKLDGPGTHLDPEVVRTTFGDQPVDAIRVTFDAEVGTDTWLFYLDPRTHALVGYRFYHDEEKNDGEYIVLNGEIETAGIRLPKERHWYVNADNRFIGADLVERYEVID